MIIKKNGKESSGELKNKYTNKNVAITCMQSKTKMIEEALFRLFMVFRYEISKVRIFNKNLNSIDPF